MRFGWKGVAEQAAKALWGSARRYRAGAVAGSRELGFSWL